MIPQLTVAGLFEGSIKPQIENKFYIFKNTKANPGRAAFPRENRRAGKGNNMIPKRWLFIILFYALA